VATGTDSAFASDGIAVTVPKDSSVTFRATATDVADNTSPCSDPITYTDDATAPDAPALTSTTPASPDNVAHPRLTGTAEAGSTIRIYTTADCTGIPAATGSVTAFATTGIAVSVKPDATTHLAATATDAAGNTSTCSGSLSYTEDSIAPQTSIIGGPAALTKQRAQTFTYASSEPRSHFECSLDGAAFTACASTGKLITSLNDGRHTFQVRAVDQAGNTDASPAQRSFTVDTTPPSTRITGGPKGSTKDRTPTFRFSSTQAGSRFDCSLDGRKWTSCGSPHTVGKLAYGKHNFRVRAIDPAGNPDATSAVRRFRVIRK
jgi:hypothetical protein